MVDVQHAFCNLPLNPFQAGLLAIEFDGHYYWELCAPFGWILAPFSWCRISSIIQRYCALHGVNCVVYVDDFLVLGETCLEAQSAIDFVINFLSDMSLPDKVSKRTPPARVVTFLGLVFDFPNSSVSISVDRAQKVKLEIDALLIHPRVSRKKLESCVGRLVFCGQVIRGARTFTRHLHWSLSSYSSSWILISESARADLRWWSRLLDTYKTSPPKPWSAIRPMTKFSSDASLIAGCAVNSTPLLGAYLDCFSI